MRTSEHGTDASVYRGSERAPVGAHAEPSATDAVERVIDAGQRLVTERIELAKLDVQDAVSEKVSQTTKVFVPALFAFGGWWILMAAVVMVLSTYVVLPASLAIVGGAHVLLGGAMAARALHRSGRAGATRNGGARAASPSTTATSATGVRP